MSYERGKSLFFTFFLKGIRRLSVILTAWRMDNLSTSDAPYKLVGFDLDGTLLNNEHEFSPRTISMLQKLHQKGIHIAFLTGRPLTVVSRMIKKLTFLHGPGASVTLSRDNSARWFFAPYNGACIYDEHFTCLFSEDVDPRFCKALFMVCRDDPLVNINVIMSCTPEDRQTPTFLNLSDKEGDSASDIWYSQYYDEKEAKVQEGAHLKQHVVGNDISNCRTSSVKEIFYVCYDVGKRRELVEKINDCIKEVEHQLGLSNAIHVAPSSPQCVDIVPTHMSKGSAIAFIAKQLNLSLSECVAFGDGMNDLSLLAAVGKGYILGNANPELIKSFPEGEVIGLNVNDAVAETVEKIFSL